MIKNIFALFSFFICVQIFVLAQEETSILLAPDDWKSEQFSFPISFAPELKYIGFEDLRFAPTWSDPKSDEFWTYTFVWYVEKDSLISAESISNDLEIYYDGLMRIKDDHSNKLIKPQRTVCTFSKMGEFYEGHIEVFDAFFTKIPMTLYARVKQSFCQDDNMQIIVFELSAKPLNDEIWKLFDSVDVTIDCLND